MRKIHSIPSRSMLDRQNNKRKIIKENLRCKVTLSHCLSSLIEDEEKSQHRSIIIHICLGVAQSFPLHVMELSLCSVYSIIYCLCLVNCCSWNLDEVRKYILYFVPLVSKWLKIPLVFTCLLKFGLLSCSILEQNI